LRPRHEARLFRFWVPLPRLSQWPIESTSLRSASCGLTSGSHCLREAERTQSGHFTDDDIHDVVELTSTYAGRFHGNDGTPDWMAADAGKELRRTFEFAAR
jgi:hypothetical protein